MYKAGESVFCELHMCGSACRGGLLYAVAVLMILLGPRPAAAQDYTVNLDWIYYKDNSGREISYDFSGATFDEHNVVTIPAGAVIARAPSETGTEFRWDPGLELQEVALDGDIYAISLPQVELTPREIPVATIAVDGSPSDWGSVGAYIDDAVGDTWWTGMTETDLDFLKIAYSPDGTRFNILIKTHGGVSGNVWYRVFLDRDLDGSVDEPDDFQIDFQYHDGSWDVVSQGWISEEQWYPIDEGGVVVVSGDFIEASVSTASFGLSGDFNVYGCTMLGASPYTTYDTFANPFQRASGFLINP